MVETTVTVWPVIVFLLLLGIVLIFSFSYPEVQTRRIVGSVLALVGGALGAVILVWVSRTRPALLLPLFAVMTIALLLFFALVVLPG